MSKSDLALMAHLMRRAGFGATRSELEQLASKGYDEIVDGLINPERFPAIDDNRHGRALAPARVRTLLAVEITATTGWPTGGGRRPHAAHFQRRSSFW